MIFLNRCKVSVCDDESIFCEEFEPEWLNHTVPWNDPNKQTRQCYRFNYTWADFNECNDSNIQIDSNQTVKCDQWVYDKSIFQSTIVTEVYII